MNMMTGSDGKAFAGVAGVWPTGANKGEKMRHIALFAALIFAWITGPAAADVMQSPSVSFSNVDWEAVQASLSSLDEPKAPASDGGDTAGNDIVRLNTATFERFPDISRSPVPVLLPFDAGAFLRDHAAGLDVGKPNDAYLGGFHASKFFFSGPAGYDAAFTVGPGEVPGVPDLHIADPAEVLISGAFLLYDLQGPAAEKGAAVPELETQFPGIRRFLIESHVHYTFVRFGVPYVVSLLCFDGSPRAHQLSCRQADRVAVHFLQTLSVVGGMPQPHGMIREPSTVERPTAISRDFTYFGPGQIIPGTGVRGNSGRVDYTVYAKIRFPMATAPAYANSQSFMNWGDCDHTGRVPSGIHTKDAAYHCRVNDRPLVFDEARNYAYPWRDNFCEHRWFYVSQCPAGVGHQGQDIRPADCLLRNNGADRCNPYQHDVVAVRDGMVLRTPTQESLTLFVNAPDAHLRVRYLHMNPKMLNQDDMQSGRVLKEGQVIGKVGNYDRRENGTTYHLHFDVQVPTRDGWVFVNPYSMLVTAYERLIGARGTELKDEPATALLQDPPLDDAENGLAGQKLAAVQPLTRVDGETAHVHPHTLRHGPRVHVHAHDHHAHCFRRCSRE
jgi:murein DD-endopeptidase MepM/ murein hydrolase activator NlpD